MVMLGGRTPPKVSMCYVCLSAKAECGDDRNDGPDGQMGTDLLAA